MEGCGKLLNVSVCLGERSEFLLDTLAAASDGGVIASAEEATDLCERPVGEVAEKIHGDVPGVGDVAGA